MINLTIHQKLARAHDQTHLVGHVPVIRSYFVLTDLLVTSNARTHRAGTQKGP